MFIFVRNYDEGLKASKKYLVVNLEKLKVLLIEEFLDGEEMSYFIISDGKSLNFLGRLKITNELVKEIKVKILAEWDVILHQDYLIKNLIKKLISKIIKPTLNAINKIGSNYIGFPLCWFND